MDIDLKDCKRITLAEDLQKIIDQWWINEYYSEHDWVKVVDEIVHVRRQMIDMQINMPDYIQGNFRMVIKRSEIVPYFPHHKSDRYYYEMLNGIVKWLKPELNLVQLL